MRAAVCRKSARLRSCEVEDVAAPAVGPGQVRVRVQRGGGQLPRRPARRRASTRSRSPPPFVPGSELAGEVDRGGRRRDGASRSATACSAPRSSAPSPRRRSSPRTSLTAVPAGVDVAAPPRSAWRTAPPTTCCARWPPCSRATSVVVLGAGGGVGLAAVQLGVAPRRDGDGRRVVAPRSSTPPAASVPRTLVDHRAGDLRGQLPRTRCPTAPTSSSTRSAAISSEPALRSLRWGGRFVTVGYASGVIPRIPLNLVLLKGVHVLGFQFIDFVTHRAGGLHRNEARAAGAARVRRACPAHRCVVPARRRCRRAALRRRRPRHRQGPPRHRVTLALRRTTMRGAPNSQPIRAIRTRRCADGSSVRAAGRCPAPASRRPWPRRCR